MPHQITSSLLDIEQLIKSFKTYSFDNYTLLKVINSDLLIFLNQGHDHIDRQTMLDLTFLLESEIAELEDMRYAKDKQEELMVRIRASLYVVNRLMQYFPSRDAIITVTDYNNTALLHRLKIIVRKWLGLKSSFNV